MQSRKELNWVLLLTTGYHFPRGMFVSMLTIGIWAAGFCWFESSHDIHMPSTLHSLLGPIIGLLLVFRTNSAYERWWEARKLIGALMNTSRFLALKLKHYAGDRCERAVDVLAEFCLALAPHLGPGENPLPSIPLRLMDDFSGELMKLDLDGFQLRTMEAGVMDLSTVLGACERIRNTPIPHAYTYHSRRLVMIYVLTLPLGITNDFGYLTVPITMLVFYILAGIEFIGEEIEDPFGGDENDLPVGQLVAGIAKNVRWVVPSDQTADA